MDNISSITNLEADILLIVWERGTVTNREVYEDFLKEEAISKKTEFIPYTTIMSTMNNLVRKKILRINRSKKTYTYFAIVDRKELTRSIIMSVADKLL